MNPLYTPTGIKTYQRLAILKKVFLRVSIASASKVFFSFEHEFEIRLYCALVADN